MSGQNTSGWQKTISKADFKKYSANSICQSFSKKSSLGMREMRMQ